MTNADWSGKTLGIIGGGNMAEALVRGVLASELIPPRGIGVYDTASERRKVFADLGCKIAEERDQILGADVLLVAVKPQVVPGALAGIGDAMAPGQLVVSIVAGVTSETLGGMLSEGARIVRVMPNTPLLIGRGVSALARGPNADANDLDLAMQLFSCAGFAVEVEESDLDAVTALSGSGPAYLFRFAEALVAGGQALGLDTVLAKELAIGTLRGAAEMLAGFEDPETLRERVTSAGGTTAAALKVFEDRDFMGVVAAAMAAADKRSRELGQRT